MFKDKRKRKENKSNSYKDIKDVDFDFERIALFSQAYLNSDAYQILSDNVLKDLDFEELFMYVDRTCSKVGQQFLYNLLITIPKSEKRTGQLEAIIQKLEEAPKRKNVVARVLGKLTAPGAYFIQSLIYGHFIPQPKWFWIIPMLSLFACIALILSFFIPLFLPIFIFILVVNFVIHYWSKQNLLTYSNSIPQLLKLNDVSHKLFASGITSGPDKELKQALKRINKISQSAIFFKWESRLNSEIGQLLDYILDLVKASFLLESMLLFRLIKTIQSHKDDIEKLFVFVGEIDAALSISSFREGLPYFTLPNKTTDNQVFEANDIYHPLIIDPIANSFNISDCKSMLISGSNMSGKTTFIRTIGVNTILSLCINTACAKKMTLPLMKLYTAIRIADSLIDETSYYYKEVKTIKEMTDASRAEHLNLFLLDELFKGTNTVERVASAKAVLSYLHRHHNFVFVSTHDLELTELLHHEYNYFHFEEKVENNQLIFDYKLKNGMLKQTNAIKILEINQFPKDITDEAKKLAQRFRN